MNLFKSYIGLILLLSVVVQACTQKSTAALSSQEQKSITEIKPKSGYYIDEDSDGTYQFVEMEEKPVLFQEQEEFYKEMYKWIKYPAAERQKGIEGKVILQASINELGFVTDTEIIQSLTPACDAIVKNAFLKATENGYGQLRWQLRFVNYKVDIPVAFQLP